MAAKRKSEATLLGRIAELPNDSPVANGVKSWHSQMRAEDPDMYGQLVELLKDWAANGESRQKFRTLRSLHRYLAGRDTERPIDPPVVSCSDQAFRTFARKVSEQSI